MCIYIYIYIVTKHIITHTIIYGTRRPANLRGAARSSASWSDSSGRRGGRAYICIYISMYLWIYLCIYVYVYMYICIYVYMYICIYVCIFWTSQNDRMSCATLRSTVRLSTDVNWRRPFAYSPAWSLAVVHSCVGVCVDVLKWTWWSGSLDAD